MIGDSAQFEALGNRLGFRIAEATPQNLKLTWQGARFPAFLCLGIALLLLGVSVPIAQALLVRGFVGPAGSLWYFPLMNVVLFAISIYLVTQKRTIEIDGIPRQITLRRVSLYRTTILIVNYNEIDHVSLSNDQISDSFAVGGSTAAQSFAVPALRLVLANGQSVLLDRGSLRRLRAHGNVIAERTGRQLQENNRLKRAPGVRETADDQTTVRAQ